MKESDTPSIRCAHTETVEVSKLHPHPKNPNTHPKKQLRLLGKYILHTGWRSPVVVSRRSGYIVAGHGRWMTAKLMGWSAVPVDYQDFANESDELAHIVADNRLTELAEIDTEALDKLMREDLLSTGFDVELTGFTAGEFERTEVKGHERKKTAEKPQPEKEFLVMVHCRDLEHQKAIYDSLKAQGQDCRLVV